MGAGSTRARFTTYLYDSTCGFLLSYSETLTWGWYTKYNGIGR
jgi:hypothetical protein